MDFSGAIGINHPGHGCHRRLCEFCGSLAALKRISAQLNASPKNQNKLNVYCDGLGMNVTILLRILPDLGSKYSLLVDGERLGDMETLNDAIAVRDRLEDHDFTIAEAHAILGARGKHNSPSR